MAHPLRHLILLAALTGALPAQTPRMPVQSLHFTVFSSRPLAAVSFAPQPGVTPQKTVFYPTARSPRYEYRGPMPLRFTDTSSGAVVAEATIPPGIRDAMLLFTAVEPAPEKGLRYQIAVLDDGAARHGAGGLAIINLSGLALSGTIGNKAVTLAAGLNPSLAAGHSVKIALHTMFKNRSYQSYADTLQLSAKERALLILFPPFYKGSMEVQSRLLVDEPPPPPATGR